MEAFSKNGIWWVPGYDDIKIAGMISFDHADGIRLSLIGAFQNPDLDGSDAFVVDLRFDQIVGVAGGQYVTLIDCLLIGTQFELPGIQTQEFTARVLMRGQGQADSDLFKSCVLRFECLTEWSGMTGFDYAENRITDDAGNPARVDRVTHRKEYREATIDSGWNFRLHRVVHRHTSRHEFEMTSEVYFEVEAPDSVSRDEMGRFAVGRLWNLVTFCVGLPCALLEWTLIDEEGNNFEVGSSLVFTNEGPSPNRVRAQMLLPLELTTFGELIPRWYSLYEKCDRPMATFFGSVYTPPRFTELQFVVLVMAAEGLHSGLIGQKSEDTTELRARRTTILEAIIGVLDDMQFHWVEQLLKNAGGLTLKYRLLQLWDHAGEAGSWLIPQQDAWAASVKTERNAVSHPGRSKLTPFQLHWARESVARVITLVLLAELMPEGAARAQRVATLADWTWAREQILGELPDWNVQATDA